MQTLRTLFLILLILLPASADAARLAVLEITGSTELEVLAQLSDGLREGSLDVIRSSNADITVMTRENMLAMLSDNGIDLSCVEGECEVETARNIGADYVISARLLKLEGVWILSAKLHESEGGDLLATEKVEANGLLDLSRATPGVASSLLAKGLGLYASSSAVSTSAISGTEGKIGGGSQLMSAKRSSIVTFESTPSGAVVILDGQLICPATPCSKQVAEGSHRVSMQAEQYHAAEEAVTISGDRIVSLTLKPAFATLTVETVPVGLPIFFNGKKRGVGGLDDQVDPGQYEVTVETPCYALAGERVVLNEGDSRSLTISPPVRKAGVEISVTDDDGNAVRATVYADGVNVGSAPGQVVVPLCTKELKIETGDGLAWTGPAKLREGEYVALPVVLKPSIFSDTNSIGMTFIAIPAGTFAVGCTIGQVSCRNDEKPAHNVKLTRSFSIMTTEVTQGQYRVITDESPSHFSQCGDDCPVEKVSWVDAVKFANALSKSEGLSACYDINGNNVKRVLSHLGCEGYRLPTEAEWEVAARGGTDTLYAGGSDLESVGWYDDNTTHPVGQKYSNSYGLYDMSGNVREWTWDTYDKDYYRSGTMIDPLGPASSLSRVYRGGSWNDRAPFSRVSFRYGFDPGYRSNFLGFRLIRTTPSSTAAANAD